mgnify:CR=1 FL=1
MFNTGMNIPSLADIAAVTGNRNGNGWGDCGGAWWIIVILFALWGGFGCDGNGYGGFGGRDGTEQLSGESAPARTQPGIHRAEPQCRCWLQWPDRLLQHGKLNSKWRALGKEPGALSF